VNRENVRLPAEFGKVTCETKRALNATAALLGREVEGDHQHPGDCCGRRHLRAVKEGHLEVAVRRVTRIARHTWLVDRHSCNVLHCNRLSTKNRRVACRMEKCRTTVRSRKAACLTDERCGVRSVLLFCIKQAFVGLEPVGWPVVIVAAFASWMMFLQTGSKSNCRVGNESLAHNDNVPLSAY